MPPSLACDDSRNSAAAFTGGSETSRPSSVSRSSARTIASAPANFSVPSARSAALIGNPPFFSCLRRKDLTSGYAAISAGRWRLFVVDQGATHPRHQSG